MSLLSRIERLEGAPVTYAIGGLPAGTSLDLVLWNRDGEGKLTRGEVTRSFRLAAGGAWSEIPPAYAFIGEPTAVTLTTPEVPSREGAAAAPAGKAGAAPAKGAEKGAAKGAEKAPAAAAAADKGAEKKAEKPAEKKK